MLCILLLNKARYTPLLKPKQKLKLKNRMENEQPCKRTKIHVCRENAQSCVQEARPCAPNHGPWWIPRADHGGLWPLWFCRFLNTAFWASFGFAGPALDRRYWAYWASFTTPLDLVGLNFLLFSYNLARHTQICNQNSTKPKPSIIGEICT